MSDLSEMSIGLLRKASQELRVGRFLRLDGFAMSQELIDSGFIVAVEAVNVRGEPTNYWHITAKGMTELKRIDAKKP